MTSAARTGRGCSGAEETIVAAVISVVGAVVVGYAGYLLGNRRLRHERLDDRRAEVLSELGELMYKVQRGFNTFASPFQAKGATTDRKAQMVEANRAFFELIESFNSNEMWLERDTCLKIEEFTDFAYLKMGEYVDGLDGQGNPKDQETYKIGREILRELQPLRRELIAEFRSILYPAPLSVFDRRRGHRATEPER